MRRHTLGRYFAAAELAVVIGGLSTTVGAGTGAAAADPVVLTSCLASVTGSPGQQVSLSRAAVAQPITDALVRLDPLGVIGPTFRNAWAAQPPIPLGTIPTERGVIAGDAIARTVVAQLDGIPVLSPLLSVLGPQVWTTVARTCTVVLQPVAALLPPVTGTPGDGGGKPSTPPTPPGGQPGGPGQPGSGAPGGNPAGGSPAGSTPDTSTSSPGVSPETPVTSYQTTGDFGPGLPPDGVVTYNSSLPQFGLLPNLSDFGGSTGSNGPLSINPIELAGKGAAPLGRPRRSDSGLSQPATLAALLLAFGAAQLARNWALRGSTRPRRG